LNISLSHKGRGPKEIVSVTGAGLGASAVVGGALGGLARALTGGGKIILIFYLCENLPVT
jgi:hypothetical protein